MSIIISSSWHCRRSRCCHLASDCIFHPMGMAEFRRTAVMGDRRDSGQRSLGRTSASSGGRRLLVGCCLVVGLVGLGRWCCRGQRLLGCFGESCHSCLHADTDCLCSQHHTGHCTRSCLVCCCLLQHLRLVQHNNSCCNCSRDTLDCAHTGCLPDIEDSGEVRRSSGPCLHFHAAGLSGDGCYRTLKRPRGCPRS